MSYSNINSIETQRLPASPPAQVGSFACQNLTAAGQRSQILRAPTAGVITDWYVIGLDGSNNKAVGTATLDILKNGVSITASAQPALASASEAASTATTGWTLPYARGDEFQFVLGAISGIASATVGINTLKQ